MNKASTGNTKFIGVSLIFFCLSALSLLVIPVVENPDYRVRAPEFFAIIDRYFQILSFNEIFRYSDTGHLNCAVEASVFSFFSNIRGCNLALGLAVARAGFTTLVFIALIFVFSRQPLAVSQISVLYCTLLSPGVIFYLNNFSTEALFNGLAISLVTFAWRWYFFCIIVFLFALDTGNALVFSLFIVVRYLVRILKIPLSKLIPFTFITAIMLALYRNEILSQMFSLTGYEKLFSIYNKITSESETNKYPIVVRPVITMMTMVDTKPSGAGAFPSSIIFWSTFFWSYAKTYRRLSFVQNSDIAVAFLVIILMTFLLPQYANAKYYIWMMVFFLSPIFAQYGFLRTAIFSTSLTLYSLLIFTIFRI